MTAGRPPTTQPVISSTRATARAAATASLLAALAFAPTGCAKTQTLEVTATAYNTVRGQTQGQPDIGAWGDVIAPDARVIAVSRDLLELGMTRGTEVRIEGLPGRYVVLDKMARRWKNRIDIHMGTDIEAARAWGRQTVKIHWVPGIAESS